MPQTSRQASGTHSGKAELAWPVAALTVLLALQFSLVFTRAINWDEFYFYHQVAEFAAGRLETPLNTIHVHVFTWLPALYDNSVSAIVAARITDHVDAVIA